MATQWSRRDKKRVKMQNKTKKSILIAMTKMGYILLALTIVCILISGAYAQSPEGTWHGERTGVNLKSPMV